MKIFIGSVLVVMYKNTIKGILGKVVGIVRIGMYYLVPVFGDIVAYALREVNFG